MDLRRYRKTRYENIYQNIKNKNYIIAISNPKTTISDIDGKKIYDIDLAKKLRENDKVKQLKANKIAHIDLFEVLWGKYMYDCEFVRKLAYKTLKKKKEFYKNYFSKYFNEYRISKLKKNDYINFLESLNISLKEKNELLQQLKAFLNWCINEEYILVNYAKLIKPYRVEKNKIEYWLPEHINKFISTLDYYINNGTDSEIKKARTIKILTIIGLALGDRIGETRALKYKNINTIYKCIEIKHSINYDPKADSPIKETKTLQSDSILPITDKFIAEINNYREYLEKECGIYTTDDSFILLNPATNKPYSDSILRNHFYYFIEKANIPKIKMYNLRHTFATNMLNEGKSIYEVSKALRHTNIITTTKNYADIIDSKRREMANSTDKYY